MTQTSNNTQDETLPIDIHTGKLLDWLVSRRLCQRTWPNDIQIIRQKISNAIQDMPAVDEITQLLSGSHINYFHCLRIVEILKDTEASSKNMFGYYSSQRMKDWQEIVKLYENNNIYLAEAAQMLVRNVNYEVPCLRKQLAKFYQVNTENIKKESDYSRNIADFNDQYAKTCKQIGIKGEHIKNELVQLLSDLPEIFKSVADSCASLDEARNFYKNFMQFILKSETIECLPLLSHIIEKGDTTVYEWKYKEPPISINQPDCQIEVNQSDAGEEQEASIDFGVDLSIDSALKSDDNGDASSAESNSWGILEMPKENEIDFGMVDAEIVAGDGGEIDFGIVTTSDLGITLESSGTDGGHATGSEALTVLQNPDTRSLFMNDLLELQCFLEQRLTEMNKEMNANLMGMNQLQNAPSCVQLQTTQNVQSMLDKIKQITSQMNTDKVVHLCLINTSPTYVDRLCDSLSRKLQLADKAAKAKNNAQINAKQANEQAAALQPNIQLIINKTKELQKQIEGDISKRYNNRPVNLMGGVNTL